MYSNELTALKELSDYSFDALAISDKTIEIAKNAIEKQIPKTMRVESKPHTMNTYWCPCCGKQQKTSCKIFREGCYCERCGQFLIVEDKNVH